MITFNTALDYACNSICNWDKKELVSEVTIVRDVYGKISFLMGNTENVDEADKQNLLSVLPHNLGEYFSGRIYWKKRSSKEKSITERVQPIIDMIEGERVLWKEKDEIVFYVSERPIAKKAWIKKNQKQESVWSYEEAVQENGTKVVTFYSFKGGMGRTTALASAALILAKQGKNVMMVDTDIEAPGLASLFFEEEVISAGVLDYLIEKGLDASVPINKYVLDVTAPILLDENDGQIYLLPAGKVDESYLQKLARIDYQDNREGQLHNLLSTMLQEIRDHYAVDYILVDARAGFHDMGGIVAAQLPHGVVLFGNDSRQSWDGITQVLRVIAEGHEVDFPILLIDAMCEDALASDFTSAREHFIKKAYTVCFENFYDDEAEISGPESSGEAHSPEFISFNDKLLRSVELYSDGSQEMNRRLNEYKGILTDDTYKKIVNRIKDWFGEE